MLSVDKNAVICDLAETYHVFDYRQLSPILLATLVVGLRDDSRIKMKMIESTISLDRMILASVLDHVKLLVWLNSEDGSKGVNRPKSILDELLNTKEEDIKVFDSPEDFEKERNRIIKRCKDGN